MEQRDTRCLWQGLRITGAEPPQLGSDDASLVDDLNSFYARFEASNNTVSGAVAEALKSTARDEHALSVTEHDLRRALLRVNTRNAAGPDGISR